jgi:hypothetical protein
MADKVLLTGLCIRRTHRMYRVLDAGGRLVVEARLYAAGRDQRTWTPYRRELADGSATRYGCACGRTSLVFDAQLLADVRRGITRRFEAAYSIESS